MDLDAKICYCFHVSRRKLVNFVRRERPKVPSQLSECGGAGTGCGWCIPFLKQIFEAEKGDGDNLCEAPFGPSRQIVPVPFFLQLEQLTPAEYEQRRAEYVRAGKGKPPPGATPLPNEENPDPAEEKSASPSKNEPEP